LNFPFVSIDATQLTREGYVGGSVMELLLEMKTAQRRLNKKEDRGILYIDEIDKTAARSGSSSDINGRPVQEELLKVLGNERVKGMANVRGTFGREKVDIDTSKMLVICGGSFQEFESNKEPIGFYDTGNGKPERESWTNSDLLEMGFIPELLGRLPIRVFLEELSTEQLVGIIKNPRVTPFKNFQCLLPEGMTAEDIPKEDLISIARQTAKLGVGARGMLSVMEEYLAPRIYGQVDTEKKEKYL
jgi:ATP-dependent Clp protease ATP-binding subunit ClpX